MNECKYFRPTDFTCRLEGGQADPSRCDGCRWREKADALGVDRDAIGQVRRRKWMKEVNDEKV